MALRTRMATIVFVSLFATGCSSAPSADDHGTTPSETPHAIGDTLAEDVETIYTAIHPVGAQASATAPDSTDASGNPVSYEVENILDGDPNTAWRVAGDGLGMEIVIDLGGRYTVVGVSLVPGYAKVDPVGAIDRFPENRRITSVVWDFADGSSVTEAFEDSPMMQGAVVDFVATTWVRLRITGTAFDGSHSPHVLIGRFSNRRSA
jgi:hypothetical protein